MKRRVLALLLALVLVLGVLPVNAQAATVVSSGSCGRDTTTDHYGVDGTVTWTLDSDGVLTVSGSGAMAHQYQPWDSSAVKKIVISQGVTSIGEWIFSTCYNVQCVELPLSLTDICGYAFANMWSLNEVLYAGTQAQWDAMTIDSGNLPLYEAVLRLNGERVGWTLSGGVLTISGTGALVDYNSEKEQPWYDRRSEVTSVVVGDGITRLGDWFGNGLYNAASVSLPATLESVGYAVFGASGLTSLTLPEGLKTMGHSVFWNCDGLKKVTVPASVESIGDAAFGHCDSLIAIEVEEGNDSYVSDNGVLYSLWPETFEVEVGELTYSYKYSVPSVVTYPAGKSSIVIPETVYAEGADRKVRSVRTNAFRRNNTQRCDVTLPSGVSVIGAYAFQYLNIGTLTLPENLMFIGQSAFNYSVDKVVYGGTESQWENVVVLEGNDGLANAVYNWNGIDVAQTSWKLENGVLTIRGSGDMADYDYSNHAPWYDRREEITRIVIEDGVTSIGEYAFHNCYNAESVVIPDSVVRIGKGAFYCCSALEAVSIPYGVTKIEENTFWACRSLKNVEMYNDIKTIEAYAFYNCYSLESVELPQALQYIGDSAFASCSSLVQTDLPENVVSIGKEAFYGTGIESVSIGRKVEVIGEGAFSSCSALAEINVDAANPYYEMKDGMLIETGETVLMCLRNTSGEVTVPEGVKTIGDYAFYGCGSLTAINLPAGLESIGKYAFYNSGLTGAAIPEGIKTIPYAAFADCNALTFIQLPASVTTIEYGAFGNYGALTMVVYAGAQAQWDAMDIGEYNNNLLAAKLYINGVAQEGSWRIEDGVLYIEEAVDYKETYTPWMNRRQEIKKVVVADGLTRVGEYALYGCENLTEIVLPDSVTEIGAFAFAGCTGLASFVIEEGMTLGDKVFAGCTGIRRVELASGVTNRAGAFMDCTSLAEIVIPENVTELDLGNSMFSGCTSLESISFPESVTELGDNTFSGCTALENVSIPGVTELWSGVFEDCTSLADIDLSNITYIGDRALACTGLEEAVLTDAVTYVGESAFRGCVCLKKVVLPAGLETVPDSVFYGCTALEQVNIPQSVTSIENCAFSDCSALVSVDIPDGVVSIGERAFCGASSLESIDIPEGVTKIEHETFAYAEALEQISIPRSVTSIAKGAFRLCTALTDVFYAGSQQDWNNIVVASQNTPLITATLHCQELFKDGVLTITAYNNDPANWAEYKDEIRTVIIKSGVAEIPDHAFEDCENLTSITIPDSVTVIGSSAFAGCTSLTKVTLPEGLRDIGYYAFSGCTSLEAIAIPEGVDYIGTNAFEYCTALKTVFVPVSLEDIQLSAFAGCRSIADVYYAGTEAQWNEISHDRTNNAYFYDAQRHYEYDAQAIGLKVETAPARLIYAKGEALDLNGMKVVTTTAAGSGADVTAEAAVTGYDPNKVGKQTLTVEYGGHETYLNVYVFGFTSASLTLEGRVAINFYADFPGGGYTPGMLFFRQEPDDAAVQAAYDAGEGVTALTAVGTQLMHCYDDLAAKEMSDMVYAVAYAETEKGVIFGKPAGMSAAQYVQAAFDTYEDEALRTMLVDMLEYGAAAQVLFRYRTDAPANAGLTAEQKACATQTAPAVTSHTALYEDALCDGSVTITGASLVLESEVAINLYASAEDGAVTAELLVFDGYAPGGVYDESTAKAACAAHKVNGLYLGSLTNIAAKAMRTPVYMRMVLTRADGSRIYSPIVRYSVESYAHKVQNTQSSSPELLGLTDKLMRYGDAAAAYFR